MNIADKQSINEKEQILHLKQLLVTLKQYHEESSRHLHAEIESERDKQKQLEKEILSIQQQHHILKDLLNKQESQLHTEEKVSSLETPLKEYAEIKTVIMQRLNEMDGFEERYTRLLKEKVLLDHQYQELMHQLEVEKTDNKQRLYQKEEEILFLSEKNKALELQIAQNQQKSIIDSSHPEWV